MDRELDRVWTRELNRVVTKKLERGSLDIFGRWTGGRSFAGTTTDQRNLGRGSRGARTLREISRGRREISRRRKISRRLREISRRRNQGAVEGIRSAGEMAGIQSPAKDSIEAFIIGFEPTKVPKRGLVKDIEPLLADGVLLPGGDASLELSWRMMPEEIW